MEAPTKVKVDNKGRMVIPKKIRQDLDISSGDVLFVKVSDHGAIVCLKAENPFDALGEDAIRSFEKGETRSLREYAADRGIDVD